MQRMWFKSPTMNSGWKLVTHRRKVIDWSTDSLASTLSGVTTHSHRFRTFVRHLISWGHATQQRFLMHFQGGGAR